MNRVCSQAFTTTTEHDEPEVLLNLWPGTVPEHSGAAKVGRPGALVLALDPILPGRILCEGCPAQRACLPDPMSYRQIDRAVSEGRALGLSRFLLLSRRPAAYGGEALDVALKYPDCLFLLLGAAAAPDESLAADLAGVDNLLLVVNATDLICAGTAVGVNESSRLTERTLELLHARGVRYGFSCCCTRPDLGPVFAPGRVEQLAALGAGFGMYYPYVPRSWNSPAPLAPSPEEWLAAGREIRALRNRVSVPLFDWGADFGFLDGLAGNRAAPNRVERGSTLLHAVDSRIQHMTLGESLELARLTRTLPAEAAEMSAEQRRICPVLADPQRPRRTVYTNL
jgi:hypothetical protein